MIRLRYLAFGLVMLGLMSCETEKLKTGRVFKDFNKGWKFSKSENNPDSWENVQLPHTVQIEPLIVNDMWQGTCWYTKEFTLPLKENQKAFIRFEGVMHEADVWLNGFQLAHHEGGYLPFVVDITDQLVGDENILKVRVNNEDNPVIPPGKALDVLDFSYYGGIYRDVNLIITDALHITDPVAANEVNSGGVLVHFTEVAADRASGLVKTHVINEGEENEQVSVQIQIEDQEWQSTSILLGAGKDTTITQSIELIEPRMWSPQNPELYQVNVSLISEGEKVDQISETTGIRKLELTDNGFLLNGESIFIRGTNRHQEYPYIGYALSNEAQYRDAVKIKNAGFDMVRLSHYPQDEAFLKACDELGIIVMNCISGWQFFGDEHFIANSYQEIKDMVRRDRNHPSIFFWEVSLNESAMTDDYMITADALLKAELPYEDIYSAGWMDHPAYDLFIPARQHGKAPDYWNFYKQGGRKVFIAEYGDWEYYAQNAGFNQKAFEDLTEEERTSRQLRGAGERRLLQQALNYQEATNSNRRGKEVGTIGHANWLMFDYNRGYADDIESSGISDIFRIPKFAFYFYQSQRSAEEKYEFAGIESGPMVKIASFWTKESPETVRVFSNADEVALYLNDSLIDRKKATRDKYSDHLLQGPFHFDLGGFEPGTLKALAYIDGQEVAVDQVTTAGSAYSIELDWDESGEPIARTASDVVFVYASILDENGQLVTDTEYEVSFELAGDNAELIGANPVKAEAGVATILLRTERFDQDLKINAKSKGLAGSELLLKP